MDEPEGRSLLTTVVGLINREQHHQPADSREQHTDGHLSGGSGLLLAIPEYTPGPDENGREKDDEKRVDALEQLGIRDVKWFAWLESLVARVLVDFIEFILRDGEWTGLFVAFHFYFLGVGLLVRGDLVLVARDDLERARIGSRRVCAGVDEVLDRRLLKQVDLCERGRRPFWNFTFRVAFRPEGQGCAVEVKDHPEGDEQSADREKGSESPFLIRRSCPPQPDVECDDRDARSEEGSRDAHDPVPQRCRCEKRDEADDQEAAKTFVALIGDTDFFRRFRPSEALVDGAECEEPDEEADPGRTEGGVPAVLVAHNGGNEVTDERAEVYAEVEEAEARILELAARRIESAEHRRDVGLEEAVADDEQEQPKIEHVHAFEGEADVPETHDDGADQNRLAVPQDSICQDAPDEGSQVDQSHVGPEDSGSLSFVEAETATVLAGGHVESEQPQHQVEREPLPHLSEEEVAQFWRMTFHGLPYVPRASARSFWECGTPELALVREILTCLPRHGALIRFS